MSRVSTPRPSNKVAIRRGLIGAVILVVLLAAIFVLLGYVRQAQPSAAPPNPRPAPVAAQPSSKPSEAARPAPRIREVRELLRGRAEAVRTGNRAAFLAGIDPAAPEAFRAAQSRLFDNLRGVPLATWYYELDPRFATDPAGLAPQPGDPDELWAPKVELGYALAGIDERPTTRPMGYLFARKGNHWYLSSDTALGPGKTWRGPWDYGPCQTLRTQSGLVLYHQAGKASAQAVGAQLDAAVRAVTAVWGNGWSRKVAVFVPGGAEELRSLVGPEFAANTIAAVAVADSVNAREHVATGQRVVLNPDGAAQLSPQALSIVLRHEITHIAARKDTVDGAPMWLTEGFADYVGYVSSGIPVAKAAPDLAAEVRDGDVPEELPADTDFQADANTLDLAYQQGWTLCASISARYGQPKLVRFFLDVSRLGKIDEARLGRITQRDLGVDLDGLVRNWQGYLHSVLR